MYNRMFFVRKNKSEEKMAKMKFTLGISVSDETTEFYANSIQEAQDKVVDLFWDNIGVSLVHNSINGDKNVDLQL